MTGRTGFKGSWLYLWLRSMGAVVTGYSIGLVGTPSMFEVADVGRKIHSLFVDICDGAKLTATIRAARPEIVIHKEHPEFVIDKSFPEMSQITVAPDGFLKRIR